MAKMNGAMGTAKEVLETAKGGAGAAASTARSTMADVAKAAVGIVATVKALGLDDMLGWVGLARRRTVLGSVAMFGAGVAVGAGLGVLLSPMSGDELRREILTRLDGVKREVESKIKDAGRGVQRAESEVEEKVGEAVEAVKGAANGADANGGSGKHGLGAESGSESGQHLS